MNDSRPLQRRSSCSTYSASSHSTRHCYLNPNYSSINNLNNLHKLHKFRIVFDYVIDSLLLVFVYQIKLFFCLLTEDTSRHNKCVLCSLGPVTDTLYCIDSSHAQNLSTNFIANCCLILKCNTCLCFATFVHVFIISHNTCNQISNIK